MPVRIRLARPSGATKLTTHYHIVAINATKRRDAKPLEVLGIYDPVLRSRYDKSKGWTVEDAQKTLRGLDAPPPPDRRIEWSVDRLRYWVGVGAEPTKTIVQLLDSVRLQLLSLSAIKSVFSLANAATWSVGRPVRRNMAVSRRQAHSLPTLEAEDSASPACSYHARQHLIFISTLFITQCRSIAPPTL